MIYVIFLMIVMIKIQKYKNRICVQNYYDFKKKNLT
jgi:hypothetical protein